jgi:TM2 domain-containing membrane protein YozV
MREPVLAAILGLISSGVGRVYNGHILLGLLWLVIKPGLWIGTGGLPGGVCGIISTYMGYACGGDLRVRP